MKLQTKVFLGIPLSVAAILPSSLMWASAKESARSEQSLSFFRKPQLQLSFPLHQKSFLQLTSLKIQTFTDITL
jgi:hypothetical protein